MNSVKSVPLMAVVIRRPWWSDTETDDKDDRSGSESSLLHNSVDLFIQLFLFVSCVSLQIPKPKKGKKEQGKV